MDTFVVYDPSDRYHASVCIGEEDVRDIIPFFKATVTVIRVTEGNLARDVSADFREMESVPDIPFTPRHKRLSHARMDNWSTGDWSTEAQRRTR